LILEISAAVAAAAFAILVVYLVTLIQSAKKSLADTNDTLLSIRKEIEAVSKQSVSLMATSEQLIREADEKLHSLDPIARSVKHTGEALEQVTDSVRQVSAAVSRSATGLGRSVEKNQGRLTEIMEYASIGLQLWQKFQSHKSGKNPNSSDSNSNTKG
jgi:uncharacterized protein YoxC